MSTPISKRPRRSSGYARYGPTGSCCRRSRSPGAELLRHWQVPRRWSRNTPSTASLAAPLLRPVRAARRSAISVLFIYSLPVRTPCHSPMAYRPVRTTCYHEFRPLRYACQSAVARPALADPPLSAHRSSACISGPSRRDRARCGQPYARMRADRAWNPAPPLPLFPTCRDLVQPFRLRTNSGIFPDASRSSSSSIQISRFSPRVDHVLTVGFSGKFRESKSPENTNAFRGLIWLRGLDLNQRPSGYEFDHKLRLRCADAA